MRVRSADILHADGGWRTLSFLKLTTECGLVGWSEFHESFATPGLGQAVNALAKTVSGTDPRAITALHSTLYAMTRNATGGIATQAAAALENACLDIKAKALGIPVCDLFGGALRSAIPLYWSQCGTLRLRFPDLFGAQPLATLQDVTQLGREVAARGFRALKTNLLVFGQGAPFNHRPGFGGADPALNLNDTLIGAVTDLLAAFREGAGPDVRLMLDLNFNLRPDGIKQLAQALRPFDLLWLELDLYDPHALARLRQDAPMPVASLESLYGRRALRPFLEQGAVDVAIIDPQWNGFAESMRMASLADTFEINVAPHNFHGPLSNLMGAHLAAAVPNFRIMEYVVDEAPWVQDFLSVPIRIENGMLALPTGPGWGADINEAAVLAHPPKTGAR